MTDGRTDPSACDYCGLPTGRAARRASSEDAPQYCCFGCRFAADVTAESGEEGQTRWKLMRLGLAIFLSMNVMVFTLALWTQDVYDDAAAGTGASTLHEVFRYLCLIFAAPVILLLGVPLAEEAWNNLRRGNVTIDPLLLLGVSASFAYSLVSVIRGSGHVYFEVACMVLVAVTLGRWLEATGKLKTTNALRSLEKLLPEKVRLISADREVMTDLESVRVGQSVRVLAGERIAVDGVITRNSAAVDQQLVTGESEPVTKETGDTVLAGTVNLDGDLLIEVTAPAAAGTLQRLVDAVCRAATSKGRVQRTADRLAAWLIPTVICIATATFLVHAWLNDLPHALMSALAVLLIACPCALGIATPLAVWASLGRAARRQVLFRDADAITRLAAIRAVCLDKTGTLTTGDAQVVDFVPKSPTERAEILHAARSLASSSSHRFSAAVRKFVGAASVPRGSLCLRNLELADVKTLPGRGVVARLSDGGETIYLGSQRLMNEHDLVFHSELAHVIDNATRNGNATTCLGWGGQVRGVFVLQEQLREEAQETIGQLGRAGYRLRILSGDASVRASTIARQAGIEVEAELLPEDKLAAVQTMRSRYGAVAMVGDGINDAPALAAADVGIAMGCGADVSRDAADVCLLSSDLSRLPWAISLAKSTVRTIRLNLFWAFAYNVVGVALAATGLLNPILAAVAMVVSSLLVVTNSLRLTNSDDASRERPLRTPRLPSPDLKFDEPPVEGVAVEGVVFEGPAK